MPSDSVFVLAPHHTPNAGSHATLLGILNAFVHVVMYGYYFLTTFQPALRQSMWWKRHITQLQLVQFAVLVVHFLHPIVWTECAYPKALSFIGLSQNLFMFLLFADFYLRTYVGRGAARAASQSQRASED